MLQQASALERIFCRDDGDLSTELANYILKLDFSDEDRRRYQELSAKAQETNFTNDDRAELEDLLMANDVLAILKSKARSALNRRNPAA
jgi:hypothetical protein